MFPSRPARPTFLFCRVERWIAFALLAVIVPLRILLRVGVFRLGTGGGDGRGELLLANASSIGEVQSLVSRYCRTDAAVLCQRSDCAGTPNPILSVLHQCDSPFPSVVLWGLTTPFPVGFVNGTLVKSALSRLDGVCASRARPGTRIRREWCHDKFVWDYGGNWSYVPGSETVEAYGPYWTRGGNLTVTGLETFSVFQMFNQTGKDGYFRRLELMCCSDGDPDVEDPAAPANLMPAARRRWDSVGVVCTPLLCAPDPRANKRDTGRLAIAVLWLQAVAAAEHRALETFSGRTEEDEETWMRTMRNLSGLLVTEEDEETQARIMRNLAGLLVASYVELIHGAEASVAADSSGHILTIMNENLQTVYSLRAGEWDSSEVLDIMKEAIEDYNTTHYPHSVDGNLTGLVLDFLRHPSNSTAAEPRNASNAVVAAGKQRAPIKLKGLRPIFDIRQDLSPTGSYQQDKCLMDHFEGSTLLSVDCSSALAAALPKMEEMGSDELNDFRSSFGRFALGLSLLVLALQYCLRRSSLPGGYVHAYVKRQRQRGRGRLGQCLADEFLLRGMEAGAVRAVGDGLKEKVMRKLRSAAEQGYEEDGEPTEDRNKYQRQNRMFVLLHHLFLLIAFLSGALTMEMYLNVLAISLAGFIVVAGLEAKDAGIEPSVQELSELIATSGGEDSSGSELGDITRSATEKSKPAALQTDTHMVESASFSNEEESVLSTVALETDTTAEAASFSNEKEPDARKVCA